MELNDSSDLPFMIFSKKYHPAILSSHPIHLFSNGNLAHA